MTASIPPIRPPELATLPGGIPAAGGAGSVPFQNFLSDAIGSVDRFQQNAQRSIGRFLSGEGEEVHQVAMATQRAELSLEMFLQLRNKVVQAYQEVMRMQL